MLAAQALRCAAKLAPDRLLFRTGFVHDTVSDCPKEYEGKLPGRYWQPEMQYFRLTSVRVGSGIAIAKTRVARLSSPS